MCNFYGKEATGRPGSTLIPRDLVSEIVGRDIRNLKEFISVIEEETGLNLKFVWGSNLTGKASSIVWPKLHRDLVYTPQELQDKVHLISGLPQSDYSLRTEQTLRVSQILGYRMDKDYPLKDVVEHLNSKKVLSLLKSSILNNWNYAQAVMLNIPEKDSRLYACDLLNHIFYDPTAGYLPCELSTRTRPDAIGLLTMNREVRDALLLGCWNIDIKSCQPSIVADLWGVNSLKILQDNNVYLWDYLIWASGLPGDGSSKRGVKKLVCSIIFGMEESHARVACTKITKNPEASLKLVATPVVKELLAARRLQMDSILLKRGAFDAFGNWLSMDADNYEVKGDEEAKVRSILAGVAQSYEVALMKYLYSLLLKDKDLVVLLHLHDGCVLKATHNKESLEYKVKNYGAKLNQYAKSIGLNYINLDNPKRLT